MTTVSTTPPSESRKRRPGHIRPIVLGVFLIAFLILNSAAHVQILASKRSAEVKATYTAESTVRRISAQLNKYLSQSDLLKRIVEAEGSMDDDAFQTLASYMLEDSSALQAIELAKDGVVTQVYPRDGNEGALGLDLLSHPERKVRAALARDTGEYTIAGPFDLVQGGRGALLFDPIYRTGMDGTRTFWGFSVLVLDWDRFVDELELDHLLESGYHFRIWTEHPDSGQAILAECQSGPLDDALTVTCEVPNDAWYFEIEPEDGWISKDQLFVSSGISFLLAGSIALAFWQAASRRQRERLHAEEMLRAARETQTANAAKSRFLFNMSHDLRTPINAVIGFSQLLEKCTDDPVRVREYTKKIQTSGDVLLSIVNHVLEMSRIESGKEALSEEVGRAADLIDAIDAVYETTIREKRLDCHYDVQVQHEYAYFDVTKAREIFLNIMGNAVKYTPDGGRIDASVTELGPAEGSDRVVYRVVVADTGIGMSEDFLPHLFEEFSRERTSTETKVTGTGLGMPIVKALVELMGGTIRVESKVGEGTTMTVDLPLKLATEEQIAAHHDQHRQEVARRLTGKRLLLAEDNDLNAEIAAALLTEHGLVIERAEDGVRCVEMVRHHPAGWYDAVLMDIQMPRADGYQAARDIRALEGRRGRIPIIAMTANAFDEDRQKAFDAGMDGYISKPIRLEAVLDTLEKWL